MARYCHKCGSPVTPDVNFCPNCGTALSSAAVQDRARKTSGVPAQQSKETTVQMIPEAERANTQDAGRTKFCRFCGNPVGEGASFCRSCGRALVAGASRKETLGQVNTATEQPDASQTTLQNDLSAQLPKSGTPGKEQPLKKSPKKNRQSQKTSARQSEQAISSAEDAAKDVQRVTPQISTLAAATTAGETDLGEMVISDMVHVRGTAAQVLSPVSGIIHGIGSFLGGILCIFKKPSLLIGTVLLAGLWFVLARLRGSDSELVKALAWLTYAEGGFDRSGLGIVGGVLGKGTVAAALISLFSSGFKKASRGIGTLCAGSGEKRGIVSILLGIAIGAAVYLVFVGPQNASGKTAMVGISGALLSLEALGGSGKLYELAQSLTSRVKNGVREVARGRCEGLLTGLIIGFALVTILSLFA